MKNVMESHLNSALYILHKKIPFMRRDFFLCLFNIVIHAEVIVIVVVFLLVAVLNAAEILVYRHILVGHFQHTACNI